MKPRSKDAALSRMRKRIRTLKSENRSLKKAIRALKAERSLLPCNASPVEPQLRERIKSRSLYRSPSFGRFLTESLRASLLYGLWARIRSVFRRYRLAIVLSQLFFLLVTVLEGGALFLFLSMISTALLPALFAFTVLLLRVTDRKQQIEKQRLEAVLAGCREVLVFPLPRGLRSDRTEAARALFTLLAKSDPEIGVLLVSPYLFSHRGLGTVEPRRRDARYVAAREEGERVFLLRGHFYFGIRALLKKRYGDDLSVLY